MTQGRKGSYSCTLRPGYRQVSMCHMPVPAGTRTQIWSGCLRSGRFPPSDITRQDESPLPEAFLKQSTPMLRSRPAKTKIALGLSFPAGPLGD